MVHWAESIGPNTAKLFERIMNDWPHPEMGYRGCRARLAQRSVPLQKRRIDSEELTGPSAAIVTTTRHHTAARQHPRFRVLRVKEPTCYKNR